jgi:hypothetical protein
MPEKTLTYEMTSTQQRPLFAHPVDKDGKSREVENLEFISSNPTIVTIVQLGVDGKPTEIEADRRPWAVATCVEGKVNIIARGDRELGEGVEELEEVMELEIKDPEATSLNAEMGDPIEQEVEG